MWMTIEHALAITQLVIISHHFAITFPLLSPLCDYIAILSSLCHLFSSFCQQFLTTVKMFSSFFHHCPHFVIILSSFPRHFFTQCYTFLINSIISHGFVITVIILCSLALFCPYCHPFDTIIITLSSFCHFSIIVIVILYSLSSFSYDFAIPLSSFLTSLSSYLVIILSSLCHQFVIIIIIFSSFCHHCRHFLSILTSFFHPCHPF